MTARPRAEQRRLADIAAGRGDWQRWGTYVSDRAWGTVREDYSADGNARDYFPHDHARSRAYRWNEDGLAGFCDGDGKGIFSGGFLGLDKIGVFDRGQPLPTGGSLEQEDATGWMAMFQLNMAAIAFELALHDPHYEPMVHRFGQDFAIVAGVMQRTSGGGIGVWNEEHGFYFDVNSPRQ